MSVTAAGSNSQLLVQTLVGMRSQLVDLQRQHDERQHVAGRREEDGAGEQSQVPAHHASCAPAGRMFWLRRNRLWGS